MLSFSGSLRSADHRREYILNQTPFSSLDKHGQMADLFGVQDTMRTRI